MKNHLFFLPAMFFFVHLTVFSQQTPEPVTSLVEPNKEIPKEVILATREFRERLLKDPYRPAYHFVIPEGNAKPGDPNGAFYSNGRYHLMYLYNREGSGYSWGHVSSKDMLHWRNHPDAIGPGDGDEGCFSGGAFVDDDGTAFLSYWMLWGDKGIGLAKSTDNNFCDWEKFENNPVIKSTEWGITEMKDASGKVISVGSSDPSNIWKKNDKYYMLTGNLLVLIKYGREDDSPVYQQGDWLDLFESENLKDWTYLHRFYERNPEWTEASEDNMCPSFLPLPSSPDSGKASDKHLLLFISHNRGCQYYIGDYDYKNDKFYPTNHGRMSWKDQAYISPEALIDGTGRQIMWSWILDDRPDSLKNYFGWNGTYGLPRSLWLGNDGTLRMRAIKELETLRIEEKEFSNVKVNSESEVKLNEPGFELMELEVIIEPNNSLRYGVKVGVSDNGREETLIYYDREEKKLKFDTRNSGLGDFGRKIIEEAPFELKNDEPLILRIFVDRSIVEVFANDRQAIARMVYPTLGGTGVSLFSEGGNMKARSVKSWKLAPSNPY
jgi:beta-fructofuranosidase